MAELAVTEVPQKKSKAIFLLFPILLAAVFGTYLHVTFGNGVQSPLACTQIVPDNATLSFVANETVAGTFVAYDNGTNSFYPAGGCPEPVQRALYEMISNATQYPSFYTKENGSQFTVDSVNSVPLTLSDGSTYEQLIFNHLNLSDPIYPCDLNEVYRNPIAQIYVYIPVINGSLAYANSTVVASKGNLYPYNCPPETGLTTFSKQQIPDRFMDGNFSFDLIFNGTNYVGANDTSYPGFDYAFNVTYVASNSTQSVSSVNITRTVVFSWPNEQAFESGAVPSPFIGTPFGTYVVVMRWFANSTLYLKVTTLA